MKSIRCILVLFCAVFGVTTVIGQNLIKGKVINGITKEPLAFVTILLNNDQHSAGVTDIDGRFTIKSAQPIATLTFSYLGYENFTLNFNAVTAVEDLVIKLHPSVFELQEIIVKATENPANRIIKRVIENKLANDPEHISSFKYISYNKNTFDLKPADSLGNKKLKGRVDSILQGGHFFMTETVSERKFIAPNQSEELILGTKASGFQHPSFASLATDIQPFSFYKDIIKILDIHYLNPISDGSLNKYWFTIQDTLYQNQDTVFIISFMPQKGKNFEALTGLLYINTNGYALQNVIAEPFEKGFIDIKIQQQYQFIDNKKWFPTQLNFELVMLHYPSPTMGMSANGRSYLTNIELYPQLNKKKFSIDAVKMHALASNRDTTFWRQYRPEQLDTRELKTYEVIDSIGKKNKLEQKFNVLEQLTFNKLPVKFMDIDVPKSLIYNQFEGFRLGLGAFTNQKISKVISVGGFFGYGTKDHQWKYGEELVLTINKDKEFVIRARNQTTLSETGITTLNYFKESYLDYRSYLAFRMDRIKQNTFSTEFRVFKYAKFNIAFNYATVTPQYNYAFATDGQKISDYAYSNVAVNLKYAYKEKLIQSLNGRISMGSKYPVFTATYARGIKGIYGSTFDYNKVEARLEKNILFKNIGETKIRVEGGFIDRPLPYGLMFTGQGSFSKDQPIVIKNYFQTMTPYEFLSDRYANIHFSHNFGSLLFKTNSFKPAITIHHDMGWGMLSHADKQQLVAFKTMEKGFYESGIQLDNILRVNYVNIAYLGFGCGVYYRYGAYAYSSYADNLVYKLSLTFSTK
jgi:hypothetical protein